MVKVRMGSDDDVDATIQERERLSELFQHAPIRSSIYQHALPVRGFYEDGISLADIQESHMRPPIGEQKPLPTAEGGEQDNNHHNADEAEAHSDAL
jgi:hypothetical protein